MSQKLSVNRIKWTEDLSEFNEDLLKNYNRNIFLKYFNEGYFLEIDVQYPENLDEPHNDLPFLPKTKKVDQFKKIAANLRDKKKILYIKEI